MMPLAKALIKLCTFSTIALFAIVFFHSEPQFELFPIKQKENVFDGCPSFNYTFNNPKMLKILGKPAKAKKCTPAVPLTILLENGTMYVNPEHKESENYTCKARCATFKVNYVNNYGDWHKLPNSKRFDCDIIPVLCTKKSSKNADYIYIHTQIFEYSRDRKQMFGDLFTETSSPKINDSNYHPDVLLIILDGMSMNSVKRQMARLVNYITTDLGAVSLNMYTRLAENSKPNSLAMFFGGIPITADNTVFGGSMTRHTLNEHDSCDRWMDNETYIQYEYEDAGYKTLWACDYLNLLTFAYSSCYGMYYQHTTHYMRPFQEIYLEWDYELGKIWENITKDTMIKQVFESQCGPSRVHSLRYLDKFLNAYPGIPKMSLYWNTEAHDSELDLHYSQDEFLKLLKKNDEKLKNSFIFVMGDHGQRFGKISGTEQGFWETNNPAMYIILPEQLRNTTLHQTIKEKSDVLTTHHDFYATLVDIVRYQPLSNFTDVEYRNVSKFGSSWLRDYNSTSRSCNSLYIPSQFCPCNYGQVPVTNTKLLDKLSSKIENDFNAQFENGTLNDLCVSNLTVYIWKATSLNIVKYDAYYDIQFYINENEGYFNVRYVDIDGALVQSPKEWLRLNRYGKESACLPKGYEAFNHVCLCYDYL